MEQPPGFIDPLLPKHVCKLKKALYGLKQAPRAWFDRFSDYLLSLGFICSTANSSLFIQRSSHGIILVLLYVDDMIVTGTTSDFLQRFIDSLSREFAMNDLGSLHYFLGIEVHNLPDGLLLSQSKYACDLPQGSNAR